MQTQTTQSHNHKINSDIIKMEMIRSQPIARKTYSNEFFASLKQSNATQNIYFSNYIEWQGAVRERWFFENIANDMLQTQGVFVTKRVEHDYFIEGFPFQTIKCNLNVKDIHKCSFTLVFRFYIDSNLIGEGRQVIAFLNHNKRPTRLPKPVLDKIRTYELN